MFYSSNEGTGGDLSMNEAKLDANTKLLNTILILKPVLLNIFAKLRCNEPSFLPQSFVNHRE